MDKKRDPITGLFLPLGDEPLDRKPLALKVPISLKERLQSIPDWQSWARKILDEATQRELMDTPRGDRQNVTGANTSEESPRTLRQTRKAKIKAELGLEDNPADETPKRRGRTRKQRMED